MATIKSSVFSFVDFNPPPTGCNDGQMPLPQVDSFRIKFQFWFENVTADIKPWAVPVYNAAPVLAAKVLTRRMCGRLRFPMPLNVFPITITNSGSGLLPLFDPGAYGAPQDFVDMLNSKNEFTWKLGTDSIYTDDCCIPVFDGLVDIGGLSGYTLVSMMLLDYVFFYAEIPALALEGTVPVGACYQIGVYLVDPPDSEDPPALSNYFKRFAPSCFFTYVEYWSKRDWKKGSVMDINYSCAVHNTAWLPLYLTAPDNPTEESVYVESSGYRRKRSGSIDEAYTIVTDQLTQWLHRKIAGMLINDFTIFTNGYYGLEMESLSKNGPYKPEWEKEANFPTAVSGGSLIKNLSYFNAGCCDAPADCCPVAPLICAQIIALDTLVEVDPSGIVAAWKVTINGATYAAPPVGPQTIEIMWRERYSLGLFTSAGTIDFDNTGNIISSAPSPFVIGLISDDIDAIELKAVTVSNGCTNEFTVILYNPCERMVGLIGSTYDAGGGDWGVAISQAVYSNWPEFNVWKNILVGVREFGSATAFSPLGSFDLMVTAGYVVTIVPDPFNVALLPGAWEKVELEITYGCSRILYQIFSNPLSGCAATTEITMDSVTATDVNFHWPRVLPTPAGGYDWELRDAANTTTLQSGNVMPPGGTIFLYIDSLTTGTDYIFRMRTVCAVALYSSWTNYPFTTL